MPFVRISLRKELSIDTKTIISKSVHESLMEDFNIPADDYFHVIEELDKHQLFYPQSYLGVSHTDNIVFIHITAGTGRTVEQKRRLYSNIANRISTSTQISINDIIIVLVENNSKENWSFGCGEIQESVHLNL